MKLLFVLAGALLCGLTTYADNPNNRIAGEVAEVRSGSADVVLILCDQASGLPLSSETYLPFTTKMDVRPTLVLTSSGPRGAFEFTNVPPGNYRLVAQKWTGPFKGLFEVHGTVIQLFGTADNIKVPSPEAEKLVLTPPGDGILVMDLDVGNSGTLFVLSTQPLLADPVLGFVALGTNFLAHAIGLNVMPYGRTTVIGVPRNTVHAWFFANDNSPGFTSETYDLSGGFFRAPAIPFVAGWSNGRHEPPDPLKKLAQALKDQGVSARSLLQIDENLSAREQYERFAKSDSDLERLVSMPNGNKVKTADLVALVAYDLMQRGRK